jgi:hypothetical protein
LDTGSKDDDRSPNEHAPLPASKIGGRACYETSNQVAYGIDSINNSRGGCPFLAVEMEVVSVLRITVDGAHQRSVISIDTGV